MNDNDIIKALECCANDGCQNCTFDGCTGMLLDEGVVLDLINRQKAEIEELQQKNSSCNSKNSELKAEVKRLSNFVTEERCREIANEMIPQFVRQARIEAIKEFAERLKEKASSFVTSCQGREIYETKQYQMSAVGLDNLVKEMVGDDNG